MDAFSAANSDEFDGLMLKVISTPEKEKGLAKPEHETVPEEDEKKE